MCRVLPAGGKLLNGIGLSLEEKALFSEYLGGQVEENAALVVRHYEGRELAGIAGVIFRYAVVPSFFLIVKGGFSGKGIGQSLTSQVLGKWGRKPLFLTVPVANRAAVHVYEKAGFKRVSGWRKIRGKEMQLMARL